MSNPTLTFGRNGNGVMDNVPGKKAYSQERSMASRMGTYFLTGALAFSVCAASVTTTTDSMAQAKNAKAKTAQQMEYSEDERMNDLNGDMKSLVDKFTEQKAKGVGPTDPLMIALIRDAETFNKEVAPNSPTFVITGDDPKSRYNSLNQQLNAAVKRDKTHRFDDLSLMKFNELAKNAAKANPAPPKIVEPPASITNTPKLDPEIDPKVAAEITQEAAVKLGEDSQAAPTDSSTAASPGLPLSFASLLNNWGIISGVSGIDPLKLTLYGEEINYKGVFKNGVGYLETPTIAINVDQDKKVRAILLPGVSTSNIQYAYGLDQTRLVSGDQFMKQNWENYMRGTNMYGRAVATGHMEVVVSIPLYTGETSSLRVDAGAFHTRLLMIGETVQMTRNASGALVPNGNPATRIKTNMRDASQSGIIIGLTYRNKNAGLPFELSMNATPAAASQSTDSSALGPDGQRFTFPIKNVSDNFAWGGRLNFLSMTTLTPNASGGYDMNAPSPVRIESIGGGAYGSSNPHGFATLSFNYNPKESARSMFTDSPGGLYRTLLTPQVSYQYGEPKYGGELKALEYVSLPQHYSLGFGGFGGYNTSSKVANAGGFADVSLRPAKSGLAIHVRGGHYGEYGGDEARRLPSTPFANLSVTGTF